MAWAIKMFSAQPSTSDVIWVLRIRVYSKKIKTMMITV